MSMRKHQDFKELVLQLLIKMGYDVTREQEMLGELTGPQPDISASNIETTLYAEVKWASSPNIPLKLIRDWAAQTARFSRSGKRAVLISSGRIAPSRKKWAEREFKIEIWDREYLLEKSSDHQLSDEFLTFFDEVTNLKLPESLPATDASDTQLSDQIPEDAPDFPKGQQLADQLSGINTGNANSADFERICEEILDYLFGDSLTDARRQSRLDDGLSILDIVYRVKTQTPFWAALARDFRARVIVFECKNYQGPVGPMQVFTTERYMSAVALRSVCFVLSRTPAHPHAKVAAQGAMRETGKLIIFLDDEILKTMLSIRDAQVTSAGSEWSGNGPSEILDQEIYDFLATMPR
ncbi:restriction endonuclease [Agrobacterium sp. Azo12]|uniref:restriction endonuclease n=1 Tax=Agrobacterium sp. Azo12 TaxID=3031129 RepID=UPI0023D8A43E|nr:restriction endonuclease [Agrobacterium sp. Azo12]MDO5897899.1 restriction endonuclease [Agrobacterium sp. Azo12]